LRLGLGLFRESSLNFGQVFLHMEHRRFDLPFSHQIDDVEYQERKAQHVERDEADDDSSNEFGWYQLGRSWEQAIERRLVKVIHSFSIQVEP